MFCPPHSPTPRDHAATPPDPQHGARGDLHVQRHRLPGAHRLVEEGPETNCGLEPGPAAGQGGPAHRVAAEGGPGDVPVFCVQRSGRGAGDGGVEDIW